MSRPTDLPSLAAEVRCEGCGRRLDPGEGVATTIQRRIRSPMRRREDGQGFVIGEVSTEARPARICEGCQAKIEAGASLGALHGRKVAIWAAIFAAALVLIAWLTPILLPYVRRALFLS